LKIEKIMVELEKLPIIRGKGWGDIIIGTNKANVDKFLKDEGVEDSRFDDAYFIRYPKYCIVINYSIRNKVNAIFFYNQDKDYEDMIGFPIKTYEDIDWSSTPSEVKTIYGKPQQEKQGQDSSGIWQRIAYNGIDFRFINLKLVRIGIYYDDEKPELSTDSKSEMDIIACINTHGTEKTFDALQSLSSETKKMFEIKGKLTSHQERFEFDLFAFAYYLLYVKQIDLSKHAELYDKVISFYSYIAYELVKHNPDEIYLKIILTRDKYSFVIEKIQAYQFEIKEIKTNIHHFAKYLFASFYMYPMMEAKDIREKSKKINGSNIIVFHKELFSVINMLESISKDIIKFIYF